MRDVRKKNGTSCPSSLRVIANFEAMPFCQNNMARPQAQTGRMPGRRRRSNATMIMNGRPARRVASSEAPRISPEDIAQLGSEAVRQGIAPSQERYRSLILNAMIEREQKSANRRMHLIPCLRHFRHFACGAGSDAGSKRDR